MAYNIIDILDKTIIIAEKIKELYSGIDYKGEDKVKFELVRKVLIKNEKKEIKYYEDLKKGLENKNLEEIKFDIYDKIAFLMNEFKDRSMCENADNINKILHCIISLHKDIFALFLSVQGKLVRNEKDSETLTYEILTNILNRKRKTIEDFERLL